MEALAVVGQPVARIDAVEKVAGAAIFGGDLCFAGMLWARTLRCPYPHARLVSLNTRKAEALEGVRAMVTARDIKGSNGHGVYTPDQPVLVAIGDKARMCGEPVALVAADSEKIADEAMRLIEVNYEPLEVVSGVERARDADAPLVHEDRDSNLFFHSELKRGDVEAALAQADIIIENVYSTPRQEHAYLEPEGGVAIVDARGSVTIYAGSQSPIYTRMAVAQALGIPESKVVIKTTLTGGGFGGKDEALLHIHLALLALKTNRPVKMVWTREESIQIHPKRGPVKIRHKLGATREGKIVAVKAKIEADGGPYTCHMSGVMNSMMGLMVGPYAVPNVLVEAKGYFTNNPIAGAMRGYGLPPPITVIESQMDILARRLGIDPVEIRLKNALRKGMAPMRPNMVLDSEVSLPHTVRTAIEAAGDCKQPSGPGKRTGRGISAALVSFGLSGAPHLAMKGTGAIVELFPDGTAQVRTGACEMGNGIITSLAQIAAEVLGIRKEDVSVIWGDTAATPKSGPTVASRSMYTSGNAVKLAAEEVKARILERAADMLEVPPVMLKMGDRRIFVEEAPQRGVLLSEVATACYNEGINLLGKSWFLSPHAEFGQTFMTVIADVEVDIETGETKVLQLVCVHDTGKAINPVSVRGQLLGSALQAMGWALSEEVPARDGVILTPTFSEYLVPTAQDIPESFQAHIVEEPYPTGPFGAKGVGEHALSASPAAILNAIYDAVGVRVFEFPATPERIVRGLRE